MLREWCQESLKSMFRALHPKYTENGEVDLDKQELESINSNFKLILIFILALLIAVIFVSILT